MKASRLITLLCLIGLSSPTLADVVASSASHFEIELSAQTKATPAEAYAQFIKVGEWWDANHSWFGKAEAFTLEARAGGCFCEISGQQQVMHMTVSFVDPEKEVRLLGGLGPLQMMAVQGAMSWAFEELKSGGSKIVHRYTVLGDASQKLDKLAPIVNQVQASQLAGLIKKLN